MNTLWIVTANAARARICERQPDGRLLEVADLVHPQSRQSAQDLTSDRPGRSERDLGDHRHGHSAYEPPTAPRDKEHARFAREVAARIDEAVVGGRCQALMLFAAPAFLGELRAQLPQGAAEAVRHGEAVDLTALSLDALRQRVEGVLRAAS